VRAPRPAPWQFSSWLIPFPNSSVAVFHHQNCELFIADVLAIFFSIRELCDRPQF